MTRSMPHRAEKLVRLRSAYKGIFAPARPCEGVASVKAGFWVRARLNWAETVFFFPPDRRRQGHEGISQLTLAPPSVHFDPPANPKSMVFLFFSRATLRTLGVASLDAYPGFGLCKPLPKWETFCTLKGETSCTHRPTESPLGMFREVSSAQYPTINQQLRKQQPSFVFSGIGVAQ